MQPEAKASKLDRFIPLAKELMDGFSEQGAQRMQISALVEIADQLTRIADVLEKGGAA